MVSTNGTEWTILITINDGYYPFFENWWSYYKKLNISTPIIVVAEDDVVYNKLSKEYKEHLTVERSSLIHSEAHVYNSKEYNNLVSTRPSHILRHLDQNKNVLYTDMDIVWLKNPLNHLEKCIDFVAQIDNDSWCGYTPYYCTGFMAFRPTSSSKRLVSRWNQILQQYPQLDQPVFNHVVKELNTNIKHLGLNTRLFPNGKQFFELYNNDQKKDVVVVHNNYIIGKDKKIERFKREDLWRV